MISKLTHFPLLFSFLPCIATILHAALFTWHCNVSPTHVIKILYRLWFNAVIIRHVRQRQSVSKDRKNKPPRKKKQERKEEWVRGPHSLGAGRQTAAGGRGFREREEATGELPARGGGDRSKDTCCGRLSIRGRGCTQGEGVQVCRGDNQTPNPHVPPCSWPQPPPWARLKQRGSELRVTRHSGKMAGLQRRAQVKVYVLNRGASSCRPHSDSSEHHQTQYIRQSITL